MEMETALAHLSELAVSYSLSIAGAIVLVLAGFIAARVLQRWVGSSLRRLPNFDETLVRFLSETVRYIVLALVLVAVLAQFGVQTASIIAALGAAGLAIGLALQGTLQNVAAGIMLLALRPFRVGEYVDASGIAGTVEEVGLFATELKTADGVYVLAPNSQLWNTAITNYSRNALRRFDLAIGIGYGDDIEKARKILIDLVEADERVVSVPEPATFVAGLGDSAVLVTARYWTATVDFWDTQFDLTQAAKQAFDENGISIPFPQRDIHYIPAEAPKPPAKPRRAA
ncbi:mechanosensitive ion channel family protein [Chelativorans alearense]|uniref:mechanosensitive ion channel family protein n=1 Tax=Chelativorans alearense TaxID=2681495 RepID=UPI0013D3F5A6|nr:mechanosensitive ion channel domain-containing protein [Chelativorans alearense]